MRASLSNNEDNPIVVMDKNRRSLLCFVFPSILVIFAVLGFFEVIALSTFKLGLVIFIILFVILPISYKYSYNFQRSTVFLNFLNVPRSADYIHPAESYNLKGSRNLYVTFGQVKLGTWQILPENLQNINNAGEDFFDKILDDGQNVVIYNHGNGGCRLTEHRIEMYKVLRKFFHVIAYDYRSYGDSSALPPSEQSLVEDCLAVFQWVRNRTKSNVFIWGHSLGTSISTHALLKLQTMNIQMPVGLILESPFNNFKEEVSEFPLAKMFKFLPWFHSTIVQPISENFNFDTDKYICSINIPVMIMHAEDDKVVPYKLGYKLYKEAQKCRIRGQGQLIFHSFSSKGQYGHKYLCRAPEILDKISNFIQLALETKTDKKL
ncbi:unnamed protein product [Ceutorhynchus assimilis]|uniref:AB hydrolase-1 domain-containing protein n=1 Tax=Ceutorhynchus assimilis TaxID=467358 RepID=A0A9N9MGT6_9CUCU|nr:unnamed protein product [Ceutorhynchus assimilis]